MFDLSSLVLINIETAIRAQLSKIKPYAECERNSDDHVMLVAVPIVKNAIEDVLFEEKLLGQLSKSGWLGKWYREIEPRRGDKITRFCKADEITLYYSKQMVNHYRHPERETWRFTQVSNNMVKHINSHASLVTNE